MKVVNFKGFSFLSVKEAREKRLFFLPTLGEEIGNEVTAIIGLSEVITIDVLVVLML